MLSILFCSIKTLIEGMKKKMRSGYTTGSCATAATKAALLALLDNEKVTEVTITLPQGELLTIPIKDVAVQDKMAVATVIKDGGDDPDITHGTPIIAQVFLEETGTSLVIDGGEGIGRVTKPGLSVSVGQAAINPVPRQMITEEAHKLLPAGQGAKIIISAPEGAKLATKTLNPKLGILGGISILGTTGIVRPMSNQAYIDSLIPQIQQSLALGYERVVFTPGGMGNRMAENLGIYSEAIVQTSNFIGIMLEKAVDLGVKEVLLFGHIGKLIKVAGGIFNTHSKIADGRREILTAHLALEQCPLSLLEKVMAANTAEDAVEIIQKNHREGVLYKLASLASIKAEEHCRKELKVGTVFYSLKGEILAYDENAVRMGETLGWKIK